MEIGGDYPLWKIGVRSWEKAADEWRLDRDLVLDRAIKMADAIPSATKTVGGGISELGEAEREILAKLITGISERAEQCHTHLAKG